MSHTKFEGFEPSNTTPIPDIFFDHIMTTLSEAKLRVMLYIFRRTLGFKKQVDAISFDQFLFGIVTHDKETGEEKHLDEGCGVKSRTALSKALKSLEADGYITSVKQVTAYGDNDTTRYHIHFKEVVLQKDHPTKRGSTPKGPPPKPASQADLPPEVVLQEYQGWCGWSTRGSTPGVPTRNSNTRNSNTRERVCASPQGDSSETERLSPPTRTPASLSETPEDPPPPQILFMPPTNPPADIPVTAEKLVQITEFLRGLRYSAQARPLQLLRADRLLTDQSNWVDDPLTGQRRPISETELRIAFAEYNTWSRATRKRATTLDEMMTGKRLLFVKVTEQHEHRIEEARAQAACSAAPPGPKQASARLDPTSAEARRKRLAGSPYR